MKTKRYPIWGDVYESNDPRRGHRVRILFGILLKNDKTYRNVENIATGKQFEIDETFLGVSTQRGYRFVRSRRVR